MKWAICYSFRDSISTERKLGFWVVSTIRLVSIFCVRINIRREKYTKHLRKLNLSSQHTSSTFQFMTILLCKQVCIIIMYFKLNVFKCCYKSKRTVPSWFSIQNLGIWSSFIYLCHYQTLCTSWFSFWFFFTRC